MPTAPGICSCCPMFFSYYSTWNGIISSLVWWENIWRHWCSIATSAERQEQRRNSHALLSKLPPVPHTNPKLSMRPLLLCQFFVCEFILLLEYNCFTGEGNGYPLQYSYPDLIISLHHESGHGLGGSFAQGLTRLQSRCQPGCILIRRLDWGKNRLPNSLRLLAEFIS